LAACFFKGGTSFPRPGWALSVGFLAASRARPHFVIGAVGIIGHVEIHHETVAGQRLRLEVAPGRIGFFSGQRIRKRQEESMGAGVKGQFRLLSIYSKPEFAVAGIGLGLTGRGLDDDLFVFGKFSSSTSSSQIVVFVKIIQSHENPVSVRVSRGFADGWQRNRLCWRGSQLVGPYYLQ
jgi:hypothetical protein